MTDICIDSSLTWLINRSFIEYSMKESFSVERLFLIKICIPYICTHKVMYKEVNFFIKTELELMIKREEIIRKIIL